MTSLDTSSRRVRVLADQVCRVHFMMRAWFLIVVLTAALSLAVFAQTMPPPKIWTDSALDRSQAGS